MIVAAVRIRKTPKVRQVLPHGAVVERRQMDSPTAVLARCAEYRDDARCSWFAEEFDGQIIEQFYHTLTRNPSLIAPFTMSAM
jgi:hypothetical protein